MKTFLNVSHPLITGMLRSRDRDGLLQEIARVRAEGAEAFCFSMQVLPPEQKTPTVLKELLDAMSDKPVYLTNYMSGNATEGITWDRLAEELLTAVELGATLIDVPADMFCSADMEFTTDPTAIARQRELVAEIHRRGGEVIMSSHVKRFIPRETVLTIAREQEARGADIAKVVTAADNEQELNENFAINAMLTRELGVKHLFLCNGTHCRRHRILGPLMGSALFLAVENALTSENQPTIAEVKALFSLVEERKIQL